MSQPIVERRRRVDADLYDIAIYIAEDNPTAALQFLEAAEQTFRSLAAMPGMGRERRFKRGRLREIRSWRVDGLRIT